MKNLSVLKTSADTIIQKKFENRTKIPKIWGEIFDKSAKSYLSSHLWTRKSRRMMRNLILTMLGKGGNEIFFAAGEKNKSCAEYTPLLIIFAKKYRH